MGWRHTSGIIALALAAGAAGLVAGSVLSGRGAPVGITDAMSHTAAGRWLADAWIEAARPRAPNGVHVARAGDASPAIALVGLDQQAQPLTQWHGKLVLLNFWATWCAPCREEMPTLERFQQTHAAQGVQVIGLAVDDAAAVKEFLNHTPVTYPIVFAANELANPAVHFGNTYGAMPYSVLIGRDGRILETRLGVVSESFLDGWVKPHL